ncbi:MAG: hypothetical protein MRJ93_00375 [Nitrososphaeraceae archaeon]|nr:hypothetical protein [Nitrososphaeraceae archaeon]
MNTNTTKIGSMFLLAAVLVVGTVAMTVPSSFASSDSRDYDDYYGKDRYYEDYEKDPYYKVPYYMKDNYEDKYYSYEDRYGKVSRGDGTDVWNKGVSIQSIKCINKNVNINGVDFKKEPRGTESLATTPEEQITEDGTGNGLFGNGGINIDRNLVNICVNFNHNGQVDGDLGHGRP